jgi:hypothetical protein
MAAKTTKKFSLKNFLYRRTKRQNQKHGETAISNLFNAEWNLIVITWLSAKCSKHKKLK